MNRLGRFLLGAASESGPSGIVSTDQRIVCRECRSDQPMASVVLLRSFALRDGRLISEVTGERVACQACGATFSIGPHGVFLQHAQALPFSPQGPARGPSMALPDEQGEEEPMRAPILPIPLRRPRI